MLSELVEHFLQIGLTTSTARSDARRGRIEDLSKRIAPALNGLFDALLGNAIAQTNKLTFIIFVCLIHGRRPGDATASQQPLSLDHCNRL